MAPNSKKSRGTSGSKKTGTPSTPKVSSAASTNPTNASPPSVTRRKTPLRVDPPPPPPSQHAEVQSSQVHERNVRQRLDTAPIPPTPRDLSRQTQSAQASQSAQPRASHASQSQASHGSQPQPNSQNNLVPRLEDEEEEEAEEEEVQVEGAGDGEDDDGDEDEGDDADEDAGDDAELYITLEALLTAPGRDDNMDKLSPHDGEGMWFDRDDLVLVNTVSEIIQDKFDGPYYSWKALPTHVRDRYFIQLAYRFTWDPVYTHQVRHQFNIILKRRLKGMVSYVRTTRNKPNWIRERLWKRMVAYWNTEDAKKRSATASQSRNSDRDGLGPHVHTSGPKSHARLKREMEAAAGRPVGLGEVFIKAHTRKNGAFSDGKAKRVGQAYQEKVEATLSQMEPSMTSDGASNTATITIEQQNRLFMESTYTDSNGNPYGIGNLAKVHGKGNKKSTSIVSKSPAMLELEQQLADANKQIKETNHQNMLLFKYLNEKDPDLTLWMQSQAATPDQNQGNGAGASTPPQL